MRELLHLLSGLAPSNKNVSQNDDTVSPCFSWNQGCFLGDEKKKGAEKRSMSINQSLLSTNTLSFITNTWNQPQASCGPTLREKEKRSEKRGMSINQDYCPPTKFHSSQTYGINHKLLWDRLFGLLLQSPFVNNCIKQLLRYLRRLLLLLLLFGLPSCTKVPSKHPPPPPLLGFLS
jgi:hypothetical protein